MRRLAAIALGLFTWGSVAACAHQMDQASANTSDLTWNLHVAGTQAKLAYGQPNSDLVGLMMSCEQGSGAVTVSGDVPADKPMLVLASGASKLSLSGQAEPDPYSGGMFMEASAPADSPALRRFARTGEMRLVRTMADQDLQAPEAAKGDIRRFFAHCEA